jgi:tetratricopeptide (TPR) repeat protein
MRGAVWVLAMAIVAGGAVALLVHSRRSAVDGRLDAELAVALDRGGIGDLELAQAIGRRAVFGGGAGRGGAAALAFADARLALEYGVSTTAEAEEALARFDHADARQDTAFALAQSAKAMLAARTGDRDAAIRIATAGAAAAPGAPYPLYALGRARALAGDLGGAARAYDAATIVAPTFLASRVARAEVLLDLGNAAGARTALAAVLAESPGDLRAQLLRDEAEAGAPRSAASGEVSECAGERWRLPAIKVACMLVRAERARRTGHRADARADLEAFAGALPDEPRLLARAALRLAQLGAVDQAAALLGRARRLAAAETPLLTWATAAVALGRGRAGALPAGARPADPETALIVARAALVAGGVGALGKALAGLGADARTRDADLERLGRLTSRKPRTAPEAAGPGGGDDPMQAYVDGLAAQLDGNLVKATERFEHALSGHGDACRAAGEYVAATRAQKRRPDPAVFARLRAENGRCVNLP